MIACAQTGKEKLAKSIMFLEMILLVIVSESLFGEILLLLIVHGRSLSVVALYIHWEFSVRGPLGLSLLMSHFSLASILQRRLQHEVVGANWVVNPPKLQEISAYFRESAVARRLQLLHQGCWGFVIVDWSSRILSRSFLKYRPSYIIIHSSRSISGGSLSRMSNSS